MDGAETAALCLSFFPYLPLDHIPSQAVVKEVPFKIMTVLISSCIQNVLK